MRFMFMLFIAFILLFLLPSQEVAPLGGRERVRAKQCKLSRDDFVVDLGVVAAQFDVVLPRLALPATA